MSDQIPWYENDRFWSATRPFLFSENIMSRAPEEVDQMLKLLEPTPKANLLDLCCGPGRHALEFARRGFAVTGVDRNQAYLDDAIKQADQEKLKVEFVCADMRRFRRENGFGAAVNFFTSIGYFDNPAEEKLVIDNLYDSLQSGGRLLMELVGKEIVARTFHPREWGEIDGLLLLQEAKPVNNWAGMHSRRIIIDGARREEFCLTIRLYSAFELTNLLKSSGFARVDIYGDLEGAPYDDKAKRMVVVAHK